MKAEDVLPDGVDRTNASGIAVRKGTVAAFLANARTIADDASPAEARREAERDILDALPALRAIGLFDVLEVRDARVRALTERI